MTIKKVSAGQPLRIPASAYNAFADVANAHIRSLRPDELAGRASRLVVQIKNTATVDLPPFGVAVILDTLNVASEAATATEIGWLVSTPVFEADAPSGTLGELDHVVIPLDLIRKGAVGFAVLAGMTPVKVDKAGTHDYARTEANNVSNLVSCRGGGIVLLGQPTTTVEKANWGAANLGMLRDPFFKRCRFELDEDLSTGDATATATILTQYGAGILNDNLSITVRNYETSSAGVYRWENTTGACGIASWNESQEYLIDDLECP